MGFGDVFARGWDLWKRNVGWLVLAGLVVGAVVAPIVAAAAAIVGSLMADAVLASTTGFSAGSPSSMSSLGSSLSLAFVAACALVLVIQVVMWTFYGGMFEMVIGAYRQNRPVSFADLFCGFRKFGAYALYALAWTGISFALSLVAAIPVIGILIDLVVAVWLAVLWIYVVPLIADQGLGFVEAAKRSAHMVRGAGWWWTFAMVVLLGIAIVAGIAVIVLLAQGVSQGGTVAGTMAGVVLSFGFAVLVPPYAICYLSVLYIASGGDVVETRAGGRTSMPAAPMAPPVAYATPPGFPAAPGHGQGASYGSPSGSPSPSAAAPPWATGATSIEPRQGGDAAWRAAADPLSRFPATAQSASPAATAAGTAGGGSPAAGVDGLPPDPPQPPVAPPPPNLGA